MEDDGHKELQLLPSQNSLASPSCSYKRISSRIPDSSSMIRYRTPANNNTNHNNNNTSSDHHRQFGGPSLDLQLSISVSPIQAPSETSCVDALKWQTAEQIRLASIEKAYAERVRELTRREMELAQSEFAKARHMWQRARDEVEKAERMKERATRQIDSTCMEITCQSCRQRFKP